MEPNLANAYKNKNGELVIPSWATGIHIHAGFSMTSNGSEGCQTIKPGTGNYPYDSNWKSFYEAIGGNDATNEDYLGDYYLTRL